MINQFLLKKNEHENINFRINFNNFAQLRCYESDIYYSLKDKGSHETLLNKVGLSQILTLFLRFK